MALQKPALKAALKAAFVAEMPSASAEQTAAYDRIADAFANAIDTFVKTGTVTVASNIPVATTGTAAAQTGFTTATGAGTIS